MTTTKTFHAGLAALMAATFLSAVGTPAPAPAAQAEPDRWRNRVCNAVTYYGTTEAETTAWLVKAYRVTEASAAQYVAAVQPTCA